MLKKVVIVVSHSSRKGHTSGYCLFQALATVTTYDYYDSLYETYLLRPHRV